MGFFDGGGKSLSFGEVGSQQAAACFKVWRGGIVTDIGEARQGTDFKDRSKLLTWANGDPKIQLPITLDTARGKCPERPESAEDDLVRTLYITKGSAMYAAARAALRKANVADFEVGGSLYVCWTSGEGRTGDARQYEMYWEPPVANSGGFMNDPAPGQPAAAMPPQQPPAGTAVPPGYVAGPAAGGPTNHPSEVYANAGGPPAQGFPGQQPGAVDPTNGQPLAPPQPVFNQQTGQWEIPQPAAPAAPPPQPVWNAATGQWEIPAPGQPAATPPPPAAPPSGGWAPGQQSGPAGPPPQGAAQPVGGPPSGAVTNPFRR